MYSYQQKPKQKVIQRCNIVANRAIGKAAEARAAEQLLDNGWELRDFQIRVRPYTAGGALAPYYFYPDFLCLSPPPSRELCFIEVKSSMTAPLTARQTTGYPDIEKYGGIIENPIDPAKATIPAGTPTFEMRGD